MADAADIIFRGKQLEADRQERARVRVMQAFQRAQQMSHERSMQAAADAAAMKRQQQAQQADIIRTVTTDVMKQNRERIQSFFTGAVGSPKNEFERMKLRWARKYEAEEDPSKIPPIPRAALGLKLPGAESKRAITAKEQASVVFTAMGAAGLDPAKASPAQQTVFRGHGLLPQQESPGANLTGNMKTYFQMVRGMNPEMSPPLAMKTAATFANEDRVRENRLAALRERGEAASVPGTPEYEERVKLETEQDNVKRAAAFGDSMTKMLVAARLKQVDPVNALSSLSRIAGGFGFMELSEPTRKKVLSMIEGEVGGLSKAEASQKFDAVMDEIAGGLWNAGQKSQAAFLLDLLEQKK